MSTTAPVVQQIPGYVTGTWAIDPDHSDVSFTVRHMMVSRVRGRFSRFSGEIVTAEDPTQSWVTATVDLSSIDTGNAQRDEHLRSADFFEVANHPQMTYRSTGIRADGDGWRVEGELSLKGVTRPVPLAVELNGFSPDPWGGLRAGFSATAQISRKDFGVDLEMPLDGGGVVIGDKIQIHLEIEAIRQP